MKNKLKGLILFVLTLTFVSPVLAGLNCADLFHKKTPLTAQVEKVILELTQLRVRVDTALAEGDESPEALTLRQVYKQREEKIARQLEAQGLMSRTELGNKMKALIDKIQSNEVTVESDRKVEKKSQDEAVSRFNRDGRTIVFGKLKPGKFWNGDYEQEITAPFEMASIPTTQFVWKEITEAALHRNPSLSLNPTPSFFKGDLNPVEQVSHGDATIWIQALNDLAAIDDPIVRKIFPDHRKGDVYRLPTESEWTYVAEKGLKRAAGFYLGGDKVQIGKQGWFDFNSDGQTHPVGLKEPTVFENEEYYDMPGNVSEWVSDWAEGLRGGQDVKGPKTGLHRIWKGDSWDASGIFALARGWQDPALRSSEIGFRLAKTPAP